jgi:hypothetical protein
MRHRPRLPAALLLGLALLLAACAPGDLADAPEPTPTVAPEADPDPTPDEATPDPEPSPRPTPEPTPEDEAAPEDERDAERAEAAVALEQECTNPDGFTVAYPGGWMPNEGPIDPSSVDVGEGPTVPADIAVFIRIEPIPIEEMADDPTVGVLAEEPVTVDGREGQRVETEATGDGMDPEGQQATVYRVALGAERTLVAVTRDVGEPAYADAQVALDAMMPALRID